MRAGAAASLSAVRPAPSGVGAGREAQLGDGARPRAVRRRSPGVRSMPAFAALDHAQRIVRKRHRAVLLHDLVEGAHDPAARQALAQTRLDHLALDVDRSEEHTSELQSLMRISYAVFCLQQKNNKQQTLNQ